MSQIDVINGLVEDVKRVNDKVSDIKAAVSNIQTELQIRNIARLVERIESLEKWRSALWGAFFLANIGWAVFVAFYKK